MGDMPAVGVLDVLVPADTEADDMGVDDMGVADVATRMLQPWQPPSLHVNRHTHASTYALGVGGLDSTWQVQGGLGE